MTLIAISVTYCNNKNKMIHENKPMYEKYEQYPGYAMTLPARRLAMILQHAYIPYFNYRNVTSVSTQI